MFDWEEDFVKALKKENPKDTQQNRYKEVKNRLSGAKEMWANLTSSLESEATKALDAAFPQLGKALDLQDAMHKHRVREAVAQAFDATVVVPMREWVVAQVDFDPKTMPDDDLPRPGTADSGTPDKSIGSASTVGTPRVAPKGEKAAEFDRLLHCLNFLASRLYMRVRDSGHKDKDVEERLKKFEKHMEVQLTRGKREGPKEKKQREELLAERDALWVPVNRLADLLEPAVDRLQKAMEELGKSRVTEEALSRIPDTVLWGACGWRLEAARGDADALAAKWQGLRDGIEPPVWAALQDSSVASALVRRVESGVQAVVDIVPRIEGIMGTNRTAFNVEAILVIRGDFAPDKRNTTKSRLKELSKSVAGLTPQQLDDAALVGRMLADLDQRVTKIQSSALWYVQEEVTRVRLSMPEQEPEHPWEQVPDADAVEELFKDLPCSPVPPEGGKPWTAADWEEAAHCAMQRLQEIGRRARVESDYLRPEWGCGVQPVADWLYTHADNALDVLDEASASAGREWAAGFLGSAAPDPAVFAAAMRKTKPAPEGAIDIRKLYRQRACLRFLRGLYVLLTDAGVRSRAAGPITVATAS